MTSSIFRQRHTTKEAGAVAKAAASVTGVKTI